MKLYISIMLIFSISTLNGCATVKSREVNGLGHPYIASEAGVAYFANTNMGVLAFAFPALIVSIPLTTIDLCAGVVTDTILLPLDIVIDPSNSERKTRKYKYK